MKRIAWIYADRLPANFRARQYRIDFQYPEPIGRVRLLVRSNAGADNFIHSEVFEHEYYRLSLASPPGTILDLGANAGFTAVYFAKLYPRAQIACVEPMPQNVEVLRQNLALNSVPARVFSAAAHTSNGTLRMQVATEDFCHRVASSHAQSARTVEVTSLAIPTIMADLGWSRVDLLKMDVEGHEKSLMADAGWLERVETLCIECHEDFGEVQLKTLAGKFGFAPPVLRNGLWILTRRAAS